MPLPCTVPPRGEAHLRWEWRTRTATSWSPQDHVVAWDEIALTPSRTERKAPAVAPGGAVPLPDSVEPRLALWRAPTDNDGMKLAPHLWPMFGKSLGRWISQRIDTADPEELVRHSHRRTVRADGSVLHVHSVTVPRALEDLPRIGVRFDLPPGFDRIRWFGDGPHETYPDRRGSALTGVWESDPDELPYLVPQEHGLRMSCRWMEFFSSSDGGRGGIIRVTAVGSPLHMSALSHTPQDLYEAPEQGLLVQRDRLTVHVDVAHRGLGTASCGPDTLPRYTVGAGVHEFSYVISRRAG